MFHVEQDLKNSKNFIIHCPICEGKETELFLSTKDYFLTQEIFNIVKCKSCNFIFTNPVPELSELFAYYDSPEYISHTVKKKNLYGRIYQINRKINLKNKYKIVTKYKNSGHILDVGSGTGELLKYFNDKNWNTTGIEPVESARNFAINNYQLDIFPESKLSLFDEAKFDVISMWHVLEHVYELNERLEELKQILKPDGFMFIAVPNIESFDATHYGKFWAALDVPRHLYHFSRQSFKGLIEKHSFEMIDMYPMKFDAYYVSLLSEKFNRKGVSAYANAFINGLKSNRKAANANNYSSMIFVVKQK